MKSLQAKLDIMKMEEKTISALPKQFSRPSGIFNVLSPLTIGEMRKVKRLRDPLGLTSPSTKPEKQSTSTTPKRRSANLLENRIMNRSISLKRMTSFARDDREKAENLTVLKPLTDIPSIKERLELSSEQKSVVRCVINSRANVFFTGSAGTGKSVILRRIIEMLPAGSTYITAATGVAASQIGGITLHAFCGFRYENSTAEQCLQQVLRHSHMVKQWKQCAHLIIDEISMIDLAFFEMLEYIARAVRNNDNPFGGIQLIVTGDFFQLPPVTKNNEPPTFCFESEAWNRCIQKTIVLSNVKRQNDMTFVRILNSVRVGKCDQKSADLLRDSVKNQFPSNVVPTKLCTHSDDADRINKSSLEATKGSEKTFHAYDDDQFHEKARTLAVKQLTLKIGAQVMLIKNLDVNKGLCNGSRGIVESFSEAGNPVVRFITQDLVMEILRSKFSVRIPGCDVPFIRRQFPLQLAWAISIHKSQGMTLDCAEISLERVFADGQAYVALSRARSLSAIRITGFDVSCVRANSKVIDYYKSIEFDNDNDDFDVEPAAKRKYRSI
uniref:ATP-dependent DNA helicase PIF1 n=1 Tax=Caenorhabditis tropicalis TaxID=1561998 RepID=A0A1I7UD53_9PELO